MGAWGVAIFSDDLAADIRTEFRERIGEGLSPSEATKQLREEYESSLKDPEEMPVFWIALAVTQWKLGRLETRVKKMALKVIDDGSDLARWSDAKSRAKRETVLAKTRAELLSDPPPAKQVTRTIKESNDWQIGEMIGFQLRSGKWTTLRVIGHHHDRGGRFAVCELLDWVGAAFPSPNQMAMLPIKQENTPNGVSQFLFQEPRKKKDLAKVVRLGISTKPKQKPVGYAAFVWPYVDNQLKDVFGID